MKIGLKLPLIMAVIAVSALYLAELISTTNARNTIFEAGQYRLMAVATSRAAEVRSVMASVSADMRAKANNPVILEATRAFVRSWHSTSDADRGAIQRAFVDDSPHPAGEREKLVDAGTGTAYAGVHRYFHEFFASHAASRAYDDLYIVSPDGRVVYSVRKFSTFGADLRSENAQGTPVGTAFAKAAASTDDAKVTMTDFLPYAAHGGAPTAFFAIPVRTNTGVLEGVLIISLPAKALDTIVNRPDGLGETGAVAFLGSDALPRAGPGIPEADWADSVDLKLQLVRDGGSAMLANATEEPYVAAFAPVRLNGSYYAVIARQKRSAILAPAEVLRRETLRDGVAVLGFVCLVGLLLARSISTPLTAVGNAMGRVARREYEMDIPGRRRADEIGGIARELDSFRAALLAAEANDREHTFKSAAFEATSAALMLVDRELTIIYVNESLVELMSEHRISLGRNVWDFRPDALPGRNLAALFPGAERLRKEAGQGHRAAEMRLGNSYLTLAMEPVRDGPDGQLLGYVVEWADVTQRRLSSAVLGAIDTALPVASFSPDGRLIATNPPFRRWTGLPPQLLNGHHWNTLFPQNACKDAKCWSRTLEGAGRHVRLQLCPARASALPVILCRVDNDRGRAQRFVLIALSDLPAVSASAAAPVEAEVPRSKEIS
ncbi:MAG: PAS domain-containing protein [Pseudomonadota bacterium]